MKCVRACVPCEWSSQAASHPTPTKHRNKLSQQKDNLSPQPSTSHQLTKHNIKPHQPLTQTLARSTHYTSTPHTAQLQQPQPRHDTTHAHWGRAAGNYATHTVHTEQTNTNHHRHTNTTHTHDTRTKGSRDTYILRVPRERPHHSHATT